MKGDWALVVAEKVGGDIAVKSDTHQHSLRVVVLKRERKDIPLIPHGKSQLLTRTA